MECEMTILSPLDGDMLGAPDGRLSDGFLLIPVSVGAKPGLEVTVNGLPAAWVNGAYRVEVPLRAYRNEIRACCADTGCEQAITTYWLKKYPGKYRLSLDDNIWFLQDIANHAGQYRSIFDNPYLGFFKQVHDAYGTKIHINLYYQTDGFDLSGMPDVYRDEWRQQAHWLRLSFHALADQPDKPYAHAGYAQVKKDCEDVLRQVERFAGTELIGNTTTLHWGEATVEGCRALRDCGYLCQVGDFNVDNDLPPVSYYLDLEQRRHINRRTIWKDNKEDIIFFRSAIILDCHSLEDIPAFLDAFHEDPHRSGFVDLLIHEQYFHRDYGGYQPDYREKVLAAVRWAQSKGYEPAFLSECVFE
jgi:hypothetical protein